MATPDNSPFKTPEKPKKEIKPNVRKVFKIAKNVGGKLFKLTMDMMAERDETEKRRVLSEAMRSFHESPFVSCVHDLSKTMDELNGLEVDTGPIPTVSNLRDKVATQSSSENSGSESNEGEQNPRPNKKSRKSASPQFNDYIEGLKYLSVTLKSLNTEARNASISLAKRKKFAFSGLNAVNASEILKEMDDLKKQYEALIQSTDSSTNATNTDPSTSEQSINSPHDNAQISGQVKNQVDQFTKGMKSTKK